MRAIFDVVLRDQASILVVGAGGGRELETLGSSSKSYRLVGVDPSSEMLALAQSSVEKHALAQRTMLIEGFVDDLPPEVLHEAATSLFVMHFLADDGAKRDLLKAIRQRLQVGAPYLHVDVCFESIEVFERLRPVYVAHAEANGLESKQAVEVARRVGTMPIISVSLLEARFTEAGFRMITPFFRGLWYAGWWLEAV